MINLQDRHIIVGHLKYAEAGSHPVGDVPVPEFLFAPPLPGCPGLIDVRGVVPVAVEYLYDVVITDFNVSTGFFPGEMRHRHNRIWTKVVPGRHAEFLHVLTGIVGRKVQSCQVVVERIHLHG